MKNQYTPNILKPEYLLQEFSDLLNNNPKSAPRLIENLMNVNYDFEAKTGYYKILNEHQRNFFYKIHVLRRENPEFDMKLKIVLITVAGISVWLFCLLN